jgi:hemin uptake protein HemP
MSPMMEQTSDPESGENATAEPQIVVSSKELFGENREIVIEHDGERYRLRITRRGKLILQK